MTVKKLKFSAIIGFLCLLLFIISCSKEDTSTEKAVASQQQNPTESYSSQDMTKTNGIDARLVELTGNYTSENRGIFKKIWKWMKAHVGTHLFDNCQGNMLCGPCAGICISGSRDNNVFTPITESYTISANDYTLGERKIQLALFNDSTLGITFIHAGFVHNDSLYIPENINIGPLASEVFDKDSVILLQGIYPVSYTHSLNGSTIVEVDVY